MEYYFLIKENRVISIGQCPCQSDGCICIEVAKEQYDLAKQYGNNYFIYENEELIINPDYEEEEKQKEHERIQELFMTRSDFFDGMIMAFGLDSKEIAVVKGDLPNV